MADKTLDDIDALYSRVGIDSSIYREFSSRQNPPADPTARLQTPASAEPQAASESTTSPAPQEIASAAAASVSSVRVKAEPESNGAQHAPRRRGVRYPNPPFRNPADRWRAGAQDLPHGNISSAERHPQVSPTSAASSPTPVAVVDESRWEALRQLAGIAEPQTKASLAALPQGTVAIFSVGGGTGRTTICATLASCLRARGERVLIADFCDESLLAHYFGSHAVQSGLLQTFLDEDSHTSNPIHLYLGAATQEHRKDADELAGGLCRQLSAMDGNVDRVLLDLPAGNARSKWPLLAAARTCLVVVVPDLHSVIAARRLEQLRQQANEPVDLYYLLNKFNPARPLHLEIQKTLSQQLGGRLLPICIQRNDAIPEALAAGATVMEYAPNAPVVEDYLRLADWISTVR
jgi:cellulose synthase operon protein YhjQ